MLKVNVVEPGKKSEPVCAGQVRKGNFGYYGLVISDGEGRYNVIKLSDTISHVQPFEIVYNTFEFYSVIEQDFPIVVDAELTIKGA